MLRESVSVQWACSRWHRCAQSVIVSTITIASSRFASAALRLSAEAGVSRHVSRPCHVSAATSRRHLLLPHGRLGATRVPGGLILLLGGACVAPPYVPWRALLSSFHYRSDFARITVICQNKTRRRFFRLGSNLGVRTKPIALKKDVEPCVFSHFILRCVVDGVTIRHRNRLRKKNVHQMFLWVVTANSRLQARSRP